jgi:hypothetical protein
LATLTVGEERVTDMLGALLDELDGAYAPAAICRHAALEAAGLRFTRAMPGLPAAYEVQAAQVEELLGGPCAGSPVVLLGDLNSGATGRGAGTTPAYARLLAAGLTWRWWRISPSKARLSA